MTREVLSRVVASLHRIVASLLSFDCAWRWGSRFNSLVCLSYMPLDGGLAGMCRMLMWQVLCSIGCRDALHAAVVTTADEAHHPTCNPRRPTVTKAMHRFTHLTTLPCLHAASPLEAHHSTVCPLPLSTHTLTVRLRTIHSTQPIRTFRHLSLDAASAEQQPRGAAGADHRVAACGGLCAHAVPAAVTLWHHRPQGRLRVMQSYSHICLGGEGSGQVKLRKLVWTADIAADSG